MIAFCRSHFLKMEWYVIDMRRMTLGRRFEGILTWDSFFHPSREDLGTEGQSSFRQQAQPYCN